MPGKLWFSEAGRTNGRSLVLVHGFPLDGRIWADQIDELSRWARVIVPDLRGFGRSHCNNPFTIESLADDLHGLLTEIGALPCVLAGLSMGGYVSLAFAEKYSSDLSGLILVDSKAEADSPTAREGRGRMIELVRAGGSAAVAEAMLPKLIYLQAVAERVRSIILDCPPLTIEHALAAMRDRRDYTEWLAASALPLQVIVGEHDAIAPAAAARDLVGRIGRGGLSVIPDAGHLAPLEQPGRTTKAIIEFLESL
jgi:3-oxoadipate enol-lactonase